MAPRALPRFPPDIVERAFDSIGRTFRAARTNLPEDAPLRGPGTPAPRLVAVALMGAEELRQRGRPVTFKALWAWCIAHGVHKRRKVAKALLRPYLDRNRAQPQLETGMETAAG